MVVKRLRAVLGSAVVSVAGAAHAQVHNTGVLDRALEQYRTAAEGWQRAGQSAATTLFWSLAAISLVWTMGQLALRRAEFGEFFGELVRYLLFTGFWAWMLANGPAHAQLIIESMIKLAGGASGQNMMSPSGVLDVGFHVVDRALTQSSILSPLDSAIGIVLALVILVLLALVGVNMLVTLIACWIVAYGGLIVLGFGGSRWTSDMAINYYRMVLSLGLQVLVMVLLVGIGESFLRAYYNALEQDVSLHEQAVLLVVAIVLLATVNRVPALIGTLANGSSPQYALGGGAGPGAALSTGSAAGALAATASRPAVESGVQLAKAAAAAAIAGSGAAAASLLDGFRSRDDERPPSASGGSVFPAPAAAPGSENAASALTKESVPAQALGPRSEPSAGLSPQGGHHDQASERPDAGRRTPAEGDQAEPDKPAARDVEAELRSQHASDEHEPAPGAVGSEDASSSRAALPTPTAGGSASDGQAPRASTASAEAGSRNERARRPAAGNASAGGAPSSPERVAPRVPMSEAVAPSPIGTGPGTPAGTFASPSSSAAPPTTTASSPSMSAPPTSFSGQPSSTSVQPVSTSPTNALAGATARALMISHDLPFTNPATAGEVMHAPKAAEVAVPAPAADRAELPAAYGAQIDVDVEAEVGAFRDKE